MPLFAGDALGPYEILTPIGAGGMGEVYKASDTRLGRTVAVKILHFQMAGQTAARQRFEREARAISSLNHPHICALYDVGNQDGIEYLVMEFLEGETLAQRLAKGALPLDDVLQLAIQIASGLESAHCQGITHRDLKPGNIMLTKHGAKILDFGLAKIEQPSASAVVAGTAMTQTQLTTEGAILGTYQYMAPEQLEGQEADTRSDIFSFGSVLYEMAVGRKAFEGKTQASLIAAIMQSDPPPLGRIAPRAFERLVEKCLSKDPARRWQTVADLRDELAWIADPQADVTPVSVPRRNGIAWVLGVVALALLLTLTSVLLRPSRSSPPGSAIRFLVQPPENAYWSPGLTSQSFAISPQGGHLAFIASSVEQAQIWIRSLDSLKARPMPGTERAYSLFWSTDSRFIFFWADRKLKKIALRDGPPQVITEFSEVPWTGFSLPNGDLILNTNMATYRVTNAGVAAVVPNKRFNWPEILPDGDHVLYRQRQSAMTWIGSLESNKTAGLIETDTRVEYAPPLEGIGPGHLLYVKGDTLMAHPFDARRLRLEGEAVVLDQGIPYFDPTSAASFSVSRDGILVYQTGETPSRLAVVDKTGKELQTLSERADFFGTLRIAPDGQRVAVGRRTLENGGADLWICEIGRNAASRFTYEPGVEAQPTWSPDGRRIVWGNAQKATPKLWWKALGETGGGEAISPGPFQFPTDWSKDGRFILFQTSGTDVRSELWVLAVDQRKPLPLIQTQFSNSAGAFSPDGKWTAFVSDDSGRSEIYVQAFQGEGTPKVYGERYLISRGGGFGPRWRGDGRELYFISADNRLMSVSVKGGSVFHSGEPAALFRMPSPMYLLPTQSTGFDVFPDGQRFIVAITDPVDVRPLTMIVNWQAGLSRQTGER